MFLFGLVWPVNVFGIDGDARITLVRGSRCAIMVAKESDICNRAAARLQNFLDKSISLKPQIHHNTDLSGRLRDYTVIVIGPAGAFKGLDTFGLIDQAAKIKRDGYLLRSKPDLDQYIFALGKTEKGAVNAVWRLMREIQIGDRTATIGQLSINQSPFIKGREVMICDPWQRKGHSVGSLPPKLANKYCPRNWPIVRLQNYVDLLDSFGYNSIQLTDCWVLLSVFQGSSRQQWQDKLLAMADQAHGNGQTATLYVYGSSVKDFETNKEYTFPGACFNDPHQRRVLIKEYEYQVKAYAPHIDRIVTHWADWGGCPGCDKCTYKTALQQHNLIAGKFHKINPKIQSAFSIWHVKPQTWPGYKDINSIFDAKVLPDEVMISTVEWGGELDMGTVRQIAGKGHKPGVWGWRLLDIEALNGMHVHTKLLEKYFRSLPPDAGDLIEWHSVDDVSQFMILSNLYVAGQLMWDPNQQGSKLLRQFTGGMFGRENAEKMALILEAVEKTGCFGGCPARRIPINDVLDNAPKHRKIIQQARDALTQVRIAPGFVPVFPTIVEPQELIREINAHLQIIATHIDIRIKAARLREMKRQGKPKEQIAEAFKTLPGIPAPQDYLWKHTHLRCWQDLRALQEELELKARQ
jgi:hypothetical protein